MPFLRKYATGSGADVYIPLIKRGIVDFAVGADYTPSAGDVKISIDGGTAANIGTLPVAVTMGNTAYWKFVFSNAELTGKCMIITVADAATKAVEDQSFIIETYGHASAMYQDDIAAANLSTLAANSAAALMDLANGVETGLTPRQALRLIVAALAGKLSGAATTSVVIRNAVADSKARITATVDADGNRTAITTDVT